MELANAVSQSPKPNLKARLNLIERHTRELEVSFYTFDISICAFLFVCIFCLNSQNIYVVYLTRRHIK